MMLELQVDIDAIHFVLFKMLQDVCKDLNILFSCNDVPNEKEDT